VYTTVWKHFIRSRFGHSLLLKNFCMKGTGTVSIFDFLFKCVNGVQEAGGC
jgi:hypothetical protein